MTKRLPWSLYLFLVALAFAVGLTTTVVASRVLAKSDETRDTMFEAPADGPARTHALTVEC